jgi:mono/diheme cytochrome c family protein
MKSLFVIGSFMFLSIISCTQNKSIKTNETNEMGKAKFKENCAQCHLTNDLKLVGPGLGPVLQKKDANWVFTFIKDFETLKERDSTIRDLYLEYDKIPHPQFNEITREEIQAIIEFVNQEYVKYKEKEEGDPVRVSGKNDKG